MIGLRMRMATRVYECLVIKTDRVDDKPIAFPLPDRISHPGRRGVLRESAAICENLPVMALVLEKSDRHEPRLDDLERGRSHQKRIRHSVGQAAPRGIVFTEVGLPLFENFFRPWLERNLNSVGCDVLEIFSVGDSPNSA